MIIDAAHQRRHPRDNGPRFRHADLDTAPEGKRLDDGFIGGDGRLPQVDFTAAHDRGKVAPLEIRGVAAAHDARHDRERTEMRRAVGPVRAPVSADPAPDHVSPEKDEEQRPQIAHRNADRDHVLEQHPAAEQHQEESAEPSTSFTDVPQLQQANRDEPRGPVLDELLGVDDAQVVESEQHASDDHEHAEQHLRRESRLRVRGRRFHLHFSHARATMNAPPAVNSNGQYSP